MQILLIKTLNERFFSGESQAQEYQRERDDQDDEEDQRSGKKLIIKYLTQKVVSIDRRKRQKITYKNLLKLRVN